MPGFMLNAGPFWYADRKADAVAALTGMVFEHEDLLMKTKNPAADGEKVKTVVTNDPDDLKGTLKQIGGSQSDHWNGVLANQTVHMSTFLAGLTKFARGVCARGPHPHRRTPRGAGGPSQVATSFFRCALRLPSAAMT